MIRIWRRNIAIWWLTTSISQMSLPNVNFSKILLASDCSCCFSTLIHAQLICKYNLKHES
jgi:hypothetical protein